MGDEKRASRVGEGQVVREAHVRAGHIDRAGHINRGVLARVEILGVAWILKDRNPLYGPDVGALRCS